MNTLLKVQSVLIIIFLLGISSICAQTPPSYDVNQPYITVTTSRESGVWHFKFQADEADQSSVWIDLNNNGSYDQGEEGMDFGAYYSHIQSSKTIKLYGKIKEFQCLANSVTELDVTGNPELQVLWCTYNLISSLDVSKNTKLKTLFCYGNKLTTLDVSNNTELTDLDVNGNMLTSLSVKNCPALAKIHCFGNQIKGKGMDAFIKSLPDRSGSNAGKIFIVNSVVHSEGNVALVSEVKTAKDKNWEVLDFFQHKPYDGVDDTKYTTKQPSVVLTTMRTEGTWKLKLKADEQAKPYIWIDKNNNKLYDYGEEVTEYNGFVEFAQSTNTIAVYGKISQLYCQGNSLTNLDITKNTALTLLDCSNNKLTDLNIVDSTRLETLLCYKNKITSLDLSKDTNLIFVSCNENMLTSIDISKNNKLTALYVSNNSLSALDVSKNTELRALTCEKNMLTSLNLFNNTKLETLYCAKNKLSTLDITKNTALNLVSCEENDINKLNLSENKELTSLYCYANEIKGQDMTNLVNSLSDRTNKKAGELYIIDTKNNEEKNVCLVADVAIAKKHNWAVFDYKGKENYGKNPYEGSTTSSSHITTEDSIRVFPIPARSVLNIRLPYSLSGKSLTVTDASGRVVMKANTTSAEKEMTLDVTTLYNGVYFLRIEDKIIRFVVCR